MLIKVEATDPLSLGEELSLSNIVVHLPFNRKSRLDTSASELCFAYAPPQDGLG